MFLRKLFSAENKLTWVLIDLCIVIIGVYCAFLIQNYAEEQKTAKERDKILSALKYELEIFRIQAPGQGVYSEKQANEWKSMLDSSNIYNYSTWRFIEPQYNYQVLDLAINSQNSEIIDFDLYQSLQDLYVRIKRIEYSERLLTEVAMEYKSIPSNLKKEGADYSMLWTSNYDNFRRFIMSMYDRSGNQKLLGEDSKVALELVNERLDPQRKKEIETALIVSNLDRAKNEDQAVAMVSQLFDDFTESEIRDIYRNATQTKSDTVPN